MGHVKIDNQDLADYTFPICSSFLTRKAKAKISRSKCEKSKAFSQPLLKLILLCLGEVTVS